MLCKRTYALAVALVEPIGSLNWIFRDILNGDPFDEHLRSSRSTEKQAFEAG